MKRKLVVHAGAHKTGSTFIQNTMKNNIKLLGRSGVGYFGGEDARLNFTRDIVYPAAGIRETSESRGELIRKAKDLIEKKAGSSSSLFLSNENIPGYCDLTLNEGFIYPKADKAFEFINELNGNWDVKFIFFVRDYSDFIESTYVQKVKEGFCYTFEEYKKKCHPERFSWLDSAKAARSVFGKDNVLLVKYENFRDGQNKVLSDILSLLLDTPIELNVDYGKTVNPSYSSVALELARLANAVISQSDLKDYRNFLTKRFPISDYGKPTLLSKEERSVFSSKYQEDCRYLGI